MRTLSKDLRNRGLGFEEEMARHCGREARVLRRVDRCIDEATGRLLHMKNPCIVLEDTVCEGAYNANCPRSIYAFWREIWLEQGRGAGGTRVSASPEPLVSIGLPVRNGERYLGEAVRSVLDQEYGRLELVISDNASDDGTEEICRQFARSDARVRYHRQPQNIGLVANFNAVLHLAKGTYFKWMGDDDWLTPTYVTRCVEVLDDDPALILVTTQQAHVDPDGAVESASYDGTRMRSARPVERFTEMLRLLNESRLLLDPLYGMMRRAPVARSAQTHHGVRGPDLRRQAGAGRPVRAPRPGSLLPSLQAVPAAGGDGPPARRSALAGQGGDRPAVPGAARAVREADLSPGERRQATAAVARMFLRRKRVTASSPEPQAGRSRVACPWRDRLVSHRRRPRDLEDRYLRRTARNEPSSLASPGSIADPTRLFSAPSASLQRGLNQADTLSRTG